MSEVHKPFQIFRVSVPDGEYSRRADVVEKLHYDAAQADLAALRGELASRIKLWESIVEDTQKIYVRMEIAEQRNAELVELLREAVTIPYKDGLLSRVTAALKPTESGASE